MSETFLLLHPSVFFYEFVNFANVCGQWCFKRNSVQHRSFCSTERNGEVSLYADGDNFLRGKQNNTVSINPEYFYVLPHFKLTNNMRVPWR